MTFHEQRSEQELAASIYPNQVQSTTAPPPKPVPVVQPKGITESRTVDELGAAMYGKPPAAPAPAESAKPADTPAPPKAEVPKEIQELRDQDSARRLYTPQATYRDALPDNLLAEAPDLPAEVQSAVVAEFREMAADFQASTQDVAEVRRAINSVTAPPSTEQRAQWHDEIVERLNAEYGTGAKQALRDAHKLIARDARMVKILNHNGVGDHPDLVLKFARLARTARLNGKLK
jgi:hypothetical protein